jgi:hypothetical protein
MAIFYKKHLTTNFLMDSAIKSMVWLKTNLFSYSGNHRPKTKQIKAGYIMTEDLALFSKISAVIDVPLKATSKSIFQDTLHSNTLFVFDAAYMSYDQIFTVMKQLQGLGNHFRIRPPNCDFILGSDQSDQKGSVLVF